MKHLFLLLLVLPLVSCEKFDCGKKSLDGKWIMVAVKENSTGMVTQKPAGINGDVVISLVTKTNTTGILFGNTPTNEIFESAFTYNNDGAISIPNLAMTKVMETSWGSEFVNNIRSSSGYSINSHQLILNTEAKTLTFKKQ
jgi:hypothetical protein